MLTPEQKLKLRQAGFSDAKIKAYEISKGITTQNKQSFAQDAISDIKQTGSNLKDTFKSTMGKVGDIRQALRSGEQGDIRSIAQTAGTIAGGVSSGMGDVITGGVKAVLPQRGEDILKEGVSKAVTPIVQSKPIQDLVTKYENLTPKQKRDADALLGIGSLLTDIVGGGVGGRVAKAGREGLETVVTQGGKMAVDTATNVGKNVAPVIKETGVSVRDFAFSQATGLQPETLKTIYTNPKVFKEARESGLNRATLAGQVEESLNKRLDNLSEIGSQYDVIKQSSEIVELPPNWLDEAINKQGFTVKGGKIRATTKSPTRDANDISGIQKFYDDWSSVNALQADEFLNMRYDLSKLSKFGKDVGRSDELENFARVTRNDLNQFRNQIPGLEEIDAKFAPEVEELSRLKKEFFDVNGELKDTAINRIANATGRGKDKQLERLKTLVPDIEDRINLLKAIEDVDLAKGPKVGTYSRAILGGGLLFTGNLPGAIALIAVSSPETVIKILSFVAGKAPKFKGTLNSIQSKIRKGEKLNKTESTIFKNAFNNKKLIEQAIDSLGVVGGVGASQAIQDQVQSQ